MNFYVGVVEDRNDPKAMGRVRVRVLGLHSPEDSMIFLLRHSLGRT